MTRGRAAAVGFAVAALLAGAAGATFARLAAAARSDAERASATAAAGLEGQLATRRTELERLVTTAAALRPLRDALAGSVDVYTLLDLFESEDWWTPWRALDVAVLRDGRAFATRGAGGELAARVSAAAAQPAWAIVDGVVPREAVAVALDLAKARGRFALVLGRPLSVPGIPIVWRAGEHVVALGMPPSAAPWAGAPLDAPDRRGDLAARWAAAVVRPAGGGELWAFATLAHPAPPPFAVPAAFGAAAALAFAAAVAWTRGRRRSPLPATVDAPPRWPTAAPFERPVAAEPRRASAALATAIGPGGGQTFGRYTLVDRIGEGGMSEIYTAVLAGAEGFQRMYVVKRLKPELALSKGAIEQFIDEAKLGSMLVHSNIVPVLDFGKIGDGYFLAAEYIVGRNLAEVIDRSVQRTGLPLPIPIACYVAHEVLEALAYAHDKTDDAGTPLRIVHRDVSPANVMATAQGEVKLLDFGIVKAEQRKARTESGNVKGNASFMSPEQARGQLVDARSDVFALGLVLYYLVSGQPLYPGATTAEVFYRAASGPTAEELARLRRLPAPLDQLVERALAIDPAARFPSARAFADALASFVPGSKAKLAALMDALFRDELRRPGRTGSSVAAGRS